MNRYVGIDIGAETVKVVELVDDEEGGLRWTRRLLLEHNKEPGQTVVRALGEFDWSTVTSAAVSGRASRQVRLERVPAKQAQASGYRQLRGERPATIISIGSHGFSVLELRDRNLEVFRENSRCSQGTGNFLRQLIERFDLTLDQACAMSAEVPDPAPLSGRCPVILKTDMTHLANKGESRARILAGLFDAVSENVLVLVKPGLSPTEVSLIGGVSRSARVRSHVARFLERNGMTLVPFDNEDDALYVEALGAAVVAAEQRRQVPPLEALVAEAADTHLETVPSLSASLGKVRRMAAVAPLLRNGRSHEVVVGLDIGSTGSKAVAIDARTSDVLWEGYIKTNGTPVGAAQTLMRMFGDETAGAHRVVALGTTGSGREIVGSLMTTCYGDAQVFVLNEIAAHAEGALHFDPTVDTIFEIGGQDAKYIRLAEGRVIDAAMNEACSAGTGSFIEEQGRKFSGIKDIVHLGQEALDAGEGVSLGQHCSVFMAEIIDEAVAAGVDQRSIVAGIYDSIIQNYLNRVKGSRSVGQVIFCQGMPFAADALAAAVARQTGSQVIIPPNPGTVGALGIALLTRKNVVLDQVAPLELGRFLDASVEKKDVFVCKSTEGCGGAGNKCRIDRISTVVEGKRQKFTWGGGCSLYDKGVRKKKLPDRAPDPFRQRQELVDEIIAQVAASPDRPGRTRIAMTDEFTLKGLFPFYATFLHRLGLEVVVRTGADRAALKRGIEKANVPFCAPMQQYRGLVDLMLEDAPDYLFLPMMREIPRVGGEKHAVGCPIVQASPDMLRLDLSGEANVRIISPVVDLGEANLRSKEFQSSCWRIAAELNIPLPRWHAAFEAALGEQERFDSRLEELGSEALAFCAEHDITPVVVLGRPYTIYNTVLNSNVPALLREQGVIAIPVDCYPLDRSIPVFNDMFWGHGQRNLRAAHQIRRTPGHYSLYCSNYSCGPDSFTLHFYGYIMEGRPFAVIETDGHSGDAGTKTRIEAFLHCVAEDLSAEDRPRDLRSFSALESAKARLPDIRERGETLLIPRMGPGAESLAACLRGAGVRAECLPLPDHETVRVGRRYTSGKECVPMAITLGSLLQRLERERTTCNRFAFFMPRADGPCRFGAYNLLHKITLERLGWSPRVRVMTPSSRGYFEGTPAGFPALAFSAFMVEDLLLEALYHTRPVEARPGAAQTLYDRFTSELHVLVEREAASDISVSRVLLEVASGRLFGLRRFLERAMREFAAVAQRRDRALPTVLLVGEIYVRCDPFANDFVVDKLEARGLRVRFSPFNEWLEYTNFLNHRDGTLGLGGRLSSFLQTRIQESMYQAAAGIIGWGERTTVEDTVEAARPYMRTDLRGEAVLTIGGPVHEWREGHIDAVVAVGPHECMPNKVSEAQFFHVAEREGLLSLTIPFSGDPIDPEIIDNFAFEVHNRFRSGASAQRHETNSRPAVRRLPVLQPGPGDASPPRAPAVDPSRRRGTDTEESVL